MSESKTSGANPLLLVSSSRLQALRAKADEANKPAQAPESAKAKSPNKEDAETARVRQLVENHLQRIMATMPSGKQRSLFKIRFGIDPDQIRTLPPQQAAKLLKLKV